MSKFIVHARVLGKDKARTPSGHPALIHSAVHDHKDISPIDAIRRAAQKWRGIISSADDWRLISTYDVKPGVQSPFDRLYVMEFIPERAMRAHLGIDEKLDPYAEDHPSWYLTPVSQS